MERDGINNISGKQYLTDRNEIEECQTCPFLRSCWNIEEYERRASRR